ncbi:hypothetical protein, partial [Pseudomonas viridiflava]|uniref:hypothetical protein n=1 Tax=Pseudomonas viridiflava TaxID=33069 RepID=UPI0019D241E2
MLLQVHRDRAAVSSIRETKTTAIEAHLQIHGWQLGVRNTTQRASSAKSAEATLPNGDSCQRLVTFKHLC